LAPVNIHQVLDHVKRVARTGFASRMRIVEEYDPSLPPVWGNRDQLVQILLNLVKNAAEAAGPEGGAGEIALCTAYHHGVRIAVPGSKERMHLPLNVSVRDDGRGGQGLGLALVAKLVADQGGLIECDSRPGRTVFRLLLAAAPASGAKTGNGGGAR
jgi:two-component system nitrogen regulation sensor histidine kinase GlnL